MTAPEVSIIIPVHDDAVRLARCLEALHGQTDPRAREILVVDNGSKDDVSAATRRFPEVRLVSEPRPGSYVARNLGLREAKGRILAFTDADCVPRPDWLAKATAHLAPGVGLVGGAIELFPADPRRLTVAEAWEQTHGFPQEEYVRQRHFAATANLVTTRDVVDGVGPFDAALRSGGDQEWGQRVHAKGLACVYAPDAVVLHPMRRRLGELATKTRRTLGGQHDRGLLRRYMANPLTFWTYVGKHYVAPLRELPRIRADARKARVPTWKLLAATWHRQGVKARELVRLRRGRASHR